MRKPASTRLNRRLKYAAQELMIYLRRKALGYEPSRTRTCDPLVKSQLLYQLSYRPIHAESTPGVLFSIARKSKAF